MKNAPDGRGFRTVVVFCLAGLYFVLAIGVTVLGSSIYRSVAVAADENSTHRAALSYVVNQVRRSGKDTVALGEFEGVPALCLSETTPEGYVYLTYIYCYEGYLRELYTEADSGLLPADGTALIELEKLEFSLTGELVSVTAGDADGRSWSVSIHAGEVGGL